MRILITNTALAFRAGTELYVRDLADGLMRRGHSVFVYSERLGKFADDLRAANINVVSNLDELDNPPDVIHGHHHLITMMTLLRFPAVPAIYVCHGPDTWQEEPPLFPRIAYYVAVDHACKERISRKQIAEDRIRLVLNFVDMRRFKPRPPLPATPARALIFSNQAWASTHEPVIRKACKQAGISVDVVGAAAGQVCDAPESILGNYDIVFAKAKSALEALAVGSAVVVCDAAGLGELVTTANVERLRALNFGIRTLTQPLTASAICDQLKRYDPEDALEVSKWVRARATAEAAIDALVKLYELTIEEHRQATASDFAAEQIAVARYLSSLDKIIRSLEGDAESLQALRHSRSWALFSKYVTIKQTVLSPIVKGK